MKNLKNKVIVVAGGTGGIGSATCRLLAARGATIIVANRKNGRFEALIRDLRTLNCNSLSIETDLCSLEAWNELIENILLKFNRIDVLVNCIGSIVPGTLERLHESDVQNMIQSNFVNTVNGAKAVIPVMRQQGYGHIINVGSLGGIVPMPFEAVYSATKFAVRGLSLSLSEELKDLGLFVSVISCGPVRTKMLDLEAQDERSTTAFILKPIEPVEVAKAILNVIYHPQREVILPKMTGKLAILLNLFPKCSGALFPFIDILGRKRQKIYRRSLNSGIPVGIEN